MKVGIITFHDVNNYGSVLQTYATQETFRNLGCETEVIDYRREGQSGYFQKMKNACDRSSFGKNPLLRATYYMIKSPSYLRQRKVFTAFRQKYITLGNRRYIGFEQLKQNPPQIDVGCTGSDQMWNSEYNQGVEKAYYLAFGKPDMKRIAYSTSIGMEQFPESETEEVRELLSRYAAISVREASALSALEKAGVHGAVQVLDPTLVLNGAQWRKIASDRYKKCKPYVLIYQLNPNSELENFAAELARSYGFDLRRINLMYDQMSRAGKAVNIPTVNEYISLLDNARYVVTDSFHGTAFCINLNTQFYVFYPPKYKTRLDSILQLTGLTTRIAENDKSEKEDIDFVPVNQIIGEARQNNLEFLRQALEK